MGNFMTYRLIQKPRKRSKEWSESNRTEDRLLETKADRYGFRFLVGNWRKAVSIQNLCSNMETLNERAICINS